MNTITITYRDETIGPEVYEGELKILSNGALEITVKSEKNPSSLITSLSQTKTVGIPLDLIQKYTVE